MYTKEGVLFRTVLRLVVADAVAVAGQEAVLVPVLVRAHIVLDVRESVRVQAVALAQQALQGSRNRRLRHHVVDLRHRGVAVLADLLVAVVVQRGHLVVDGLHEGAREPDLLGRDGHPALHDERLDRAVVQELRRLLLRRARRTRRRIGCVRRRGCGATATGHVRQQRAEATRGNHGNDARVRKYR